MTTVFLFMSVIFHDVLHHPETCHQNECVLSSLKYSKDLSLSSRSNVYFLFSWIQFQNKLWASPRGDNGYVSSEWTWITVDARTVHTDLSLRGSQNIFSWNVKLRNKVGHDCPFTIHIHVLFKMQCNVSGFLSCSSTKVNINSSTHLLKRFFILYV
jgi:hypothetical protein